METTILFLLGVFGLVFGSFATSLTYQIVKKDFSWAKLWRRSKCPRCHKLIQWYDNVPLLSYIVLGGKCRVCGKPISKRYPLIEAATLSIFLLVALSGQQNLYPLPYLLFLITALVAVAVVDLEHQIIPDRILFPLLTTNYILLATFSPSPTLFVHFFWASTAAIFFLFLYVITNGRGMGLGDVKLAFLIGLLLGDQTWVAIFLAFIIGAIVGILLVVARMAHFGKPIPFGPFLVLGTLMVLLWGVELENLILGGVK